MKKSNRILSALGCYALLLGICFTPSKAFSSDVAPMAGSSVDQTPRNQSVRLTDTRDATNLDPGRSNFCSAGSANWVNVVENKQCIDQSSSYPVNKAIFRLYVPAHVDNGDPDYYGYCSGFVICQDYVLTNNHCIVKQSDLDGDATHAPASFQFMVEESDCGNSNCDSPGACNQSAWPSKHILVDWSPFAGLDYSLIRIGKNNDPTPRYPADVYSGIQLRPEAAMGEERIYTTHHACGYGKKDSYLPIPGSPDSADNATDIGHCHAFYQSDQPTDTFSHYCEIDGGASGSPVLNYGTSLTSLAVGLNHVGGGADGLATAISMRAIIDDLGPNLPACALPSDYYYIRGTITLNGSPQPNIEVTIPGHTTYTKTNGIYQINALKNGTYTVTPTLPISSGCPIITGFSQASITVTVNGGNVTGKDFQLIEDYSIGGTANENGTLTNNVDIAATLQDPTQQIFTVQTGSDPTWSKGQYFLCGLPDGTYHVTASRKITIINPPLTYTVDYNPFPYAVVTPPNKVQDFGLISRMLPFTGAIAVTKFPGQISLEGWTVTAVSAGYWATTTTDASGDYTLSLPPGSYTIYMQNQCTTAYPPYLTATVGTVALSNQNFLWTGWQACPQCYPTLYKDLSDCGSLVIGQTDCIIGATRKFQRCATAATQSVDSFLNNATLLSVEVQRSTGKPQEQDYPVNVAYEGDYYVNITDGDIFDERTVVSSAEIGLAPYGDLFGPNDFNKNVFLLTKMIHLTPGSYTLTTTLRSQPGSYLTILISNVDLSSFPGLP